MIYMRGAGSMAAGIVFVAIFLIFIFLMMIGRQSDARTIQARLSALLIMVVVVLVSGGLSMILHSEVNAGRLLASILLFFVFALAALAVVQLAETLSDEVVDWAIRLVFYILLAAGILGVFHISPFLSDGLRAVVFFKEPSHYSLSFLPFLFYMVLRAKLKWKVVWIITGLILALLLESLTLMVGSMLISFMVLRIRHLLFLSPAILIALLYISLDYYAERMNFSTDSTNFSTLVYLSGWERAYLGCRETYGLGLGFQQFGILGDQGTFNKIIIHLLGDTLNVLDGGSVGAKFIGEFGIIGIALIALYVAAALRIFFTLQLPGGQDRLRADCKQMFFTACFVMFSIDMFVRGVAYFSSSGLLFTASMLWLASSPKQFVPAPDNPTISI